MKIIASEAAALNAAICALEEREGRPSTVSQTARTVLRRLCPHPKDQRANFIGKRLDCALCGALLVAEAVQ